MALSSTSAPPAAQPIAPRELRRVLGRFATGVTIVTTHDEAAGPVGMTANAVTSLSLDPPLILVCFDRASVTLGAVRAHGAFAVNVLAADQHELSTAFARSAAHEVWEHVPHRRGPTGSPRLGDALATLECAVEHVLPGGDHEIVIGRVLDAEAREDERDPLLYYRGAYAELAA